MAADFVKINGALFNTSDVKRIVPDNDGTVMVYLEGQGFEFTVEEGKEQPWADDLACQMGKLIDTSDTPVERG